MLSRAHADETVNLPFAARLITINADVSYILERFLGADRRDHEQHLCSAGSWDHEMVR
jgi:hypothetical protein